MIAFDRSFGILIVIYMLLIANVIHEYKDLLDLSLEAACQDKGEYHVDAIACYRVEAPVDEPDCGREGVLVDAVACGRVEALACELPCVNT